jgi:hypothetical protein
VLNEIRAQHINEPGVAEATYQLLYTAGLLVPRGVPGAPMPVAPAEPSAAGQPSKLWTPGQDAPAAPGNKPAIWTP